MQGKFLTYVGNLYYSSDANSAVALLVIHFQCFKHSFLKDTIQTTAFQQQSKAVYGTVLDTKSLELAFLDILVHNSAILNAMTIN